MKIRDIIMENHELEACERGSDESLTGVASSIITNKRDYDDMDENSLSPTKMQIIGHENNNDIPFVLNTQQQQQDQLKNDDLHSNSDEVSVKCFIFHLKKIKYRYFDRYSVIIQIWRPSRVPP